jgi:glycosyltransferase involved in cell wall biosynthesis
MTFSVVIPVYNRTATLKSAIESVFCQTFDDYEIIVADDGSDFAVQKCLQPYMGRIRYLRLDKNSGVSTARNDGIKAAGGEYIAFLDSDDIWLENKLELQIKYLRETGLKVCHTDEFWYKNGKFINQGKKHARYGGDIFAKVLDFCRISPSSVVLHKSVFENTGMFNPAMRVCEDYELWLRVCAMYKVCYIDKKTLIKRAVTDDQLSDTIEHIEFIRMQALSDFLNSAELTDDQRLAAEIELERKKAITSSGLDK